MKIEILEQFGIKPCLEGICIIAVTTKWCNSCHGLLMILEKFRREGIVNIAKINLDQHPSISTILDIKALPALFFFKDGILLNKNVEINEYTFVKNGVMAGITCETVLKEIINQI